MSNKVYTIEEIIKKVSTILSDFSIKRAILFGSYAKNTQDSNSDIDIVVDSGGKLLNIGFYGLLEELVEVLEKKVDLIEISEIKKGSQIYKDIQEEGIIIYEE